jgi:hypothetical protein
MSSIPFHLIIIISIITIIIIIIIIVVVVTSVIIGVLIANENYGLLVSNVYKNGKGTP